MNKALRVILLNIIMLTGILTYCRAGIVQEARIFDPYQYGESPISKADEYGNERALITLKGKTIDCSGLVTMAEKLHSRYTADDMHNDLTYGISWNELSEGNLITRNDHTIIFIAWVDSETKKEMNTIEATMILKNGVTTYQGVLEKESQESIDYDIDRYLNPVYYPNGYLANEHFRPSRFKEDTEKPQVNIYGAIEGKTYYRPITVMYRGKDAIDPFPHTEGHINGTAFEQDKGRTEKKKGPYYIDATCSDWRGNISTASLSFNIGEYPPNSAGATYQDGHGRFYSTGAVVADWGQSSGGRIFCPGSSGFPMTENSGASLSKFIVHCS